MSAIVNSIKIFFISLFYKVKGSLQNVWFFMFPRKKPLPKPKRIIDDNILVSSKAYHSLFLEDAPSSSILVSEHVWESIKNSLPDGYKIPNKCVLETFFPMKAERYNNIIINPAPAPALFVNTDVWERIAKNIPESYKLPTPILHFINEKMSDESYNQLFESRGNEKKAFVDDAVWKKIIANIPDGYSMPNDVSISLLVGLRIDSDQSDRQSVEK